MDVVDGQQREIFRAREQKEDLVELHVYLRLLPHEELDQELGQLHVMLLLKQLEVEDVLDDRQDAELYVRVVDVQQPVNRF